MQRQLLILVAFLTFIFVLGRVEARRPAVEPVMGISIDEYQHVPPEKARGFDFTQKQTKKNNEKVLKQKVSNSHPAQLPQVNNEKDTSAWSWTLIGFLFLLPALIWFSVYRALFKSRTEPEISQNLPDNVTELFKEPKEKKDIKKAS
jgi:hypothetical protein